MVKLKLIVLLLMVVAVVTAQEKVNYLVYKASYQLITKKKTEEIKQDGTIISVGEKQVITSRTDGNGTVKDNVIKIYDRKSNVIVYDYKSEDFLIEDADTILWEDGNLKATNKTETINGYKCRAYELNSEKSKLSWYSCIESEPSKFCYKYTVWITEDIVMDESASKLVSMPLMNSISVFSFKGVIVRLDWESGDDKKTAKGIVLLEKAESKHKIEPLQMPWFREKAKSILPMVDESGNFYRYTSEQFPEYMQRLIALRNRITGRDKHNRSFIKYANFPF